MSAELERRGELRKIGGAPPAPLISTVPTAANAGYYAEIVAEKAILRRLVEAGTRIVQYGYAGADGQDVAEVVDRAQAEVYEVTERRTAEDYVPLEELLQPTMDGSTPSPPAAAVTGRSRIRRSRQTDQRPASGPDDHRRRPTGCRQSARPRHPAAHPERLDDDGPGLGR